MSIQLISKILSRVLIVLTSLLVLNCNYGVDLETRNKVINSIEKFYSFDSFINSDYPIGFFNKDFYFTENYIYKGTIGDFYEYSHKNHDALAIIERVRNNFGKIDELKIDNVSFHFSGSDIPGEFFDVELSILYENVFASESITIISKNENLMIYEYSIDSIRIRPGVILRKLH